jgi:hypothetical protein
MATRQRNPATTQTGPTLRFGVNRAGGGQAAPVAQSEILGRYLIRIVYRIMILCDVTNRLLVVLLFDMMKSWVPHRHSALTYVRRTTGGHRPPLQLVVVQKPDPPSGNDGWVIRE